MALAAFARTRRRLPRCVTVRVCGLACVLAWSQSASAQMAITWTAPEACPREPAFVAEVERVLGRALSPEDGVRVNVHAEVASDGPGFTLELRTQAGAAEGERRLRAPSCDELFAAAAVIVALLVDPAAVHRRSASPAASAPSSATAPPPTSTSRSASTSPPASASAPASVAPEVTPLPAEPPVAEATEPAGAASPAAPAPEEPAVEQTAGAMPHWFVRADLVGDYGSLPEFGLGPGLGIGAQLGALTVELSGSYLPSQQAVVDLRSVAVLQVATAGVGLCYALAVAPALAPCMRAEYGRMWGRGQGLRRGDLEGSGSLALVQLGLRAQWLPEPWFALGAEIGPGLLTLHTVFTVAGVGTVHEPNTLVLRLRAGLALRF
jgi:hypothetical protein